MLPKANKLLVYLTVLVPAKPRPLRLLLHQELHPHTLSLREC